MVCDQLNLTQRCCVGSIDQGRTFRVFDLGEMLKMYESSARKRLFQEAAARAMRIASDGETVP